MEEYVERELSSGAIVRLTPVPPYAADDLFRKYPAPEYPMVKVGGVETKPALAETPEWVKYQRDIQEHRRTMAVLSMEHELNYGVVSWMLPGKESFQEMPPEGWQVPRRITVLYKIETATDPAARRAQFIRHALLKTEADRKVVEDVITSMKPITDGEVTSALDPTSSGEKLPEE